MLPTRSLLATLLLATMLVAAALAATPSSGSWLYVLSEQGAGWDGWVYRAPLSALSSSLEQLPFTNGARSMIADNNYVYWGIYNGTWYVSRASHDFKAIEPNWLMMDGSVCGKGLIYAWVVDTIGNTLWYQGQADYVLCALNMTTMIARSYGKFAYSGGGGMNGQLQLYRDPSSNVVRGLLWGLDSGELPNNQGCIMYMDVTSGPSTPRQVNCGLLAFPRAGVVLPRTNTSVVGGYNTAGQLYTIDIFTGATLLTAQGGAATCGAAVDPATMDVYIGSPGAASVAGIYRLAANATSYTKVLGAGSMCSYCICSVSIVTPGAPPPPTPSPPSPPPPPPPASVPYVQWVIPLNGSDAGGYMLYVAGSGFVNSSRLACRFGRTIVPASQYIASDVIGCIVPESPIAGQALVAVANDGVNFSTERVYFTYLDEAKRRRSLQ